MELKVWSVCCTVLLVITQLQETGAHPVPDTEGELSSFKDVLQRLEEKLSVIEALESSPDDQEPNDLLPASEGNEGTQQQTEPRVFPSNVFTARDSYLKGLRSLQNPRMMRGSSCFGRRIDRIDSRSGMGCNSYRMH